MADYITANEFKTRFGITVSTDDTRIAAHCSAASLEVDSMCGRQFSTASETTRYFRPDGRYVARIDDAYEISAVALDTADDGTYATTLTAGTDYLTDPYLANPAATSVYGIGPNGQSGWPVERLEATGYTYWFYMHTRRPSLSVTAKFGWPAVPADVKEATFLLAHRLYYERDVPSGNTPGSIEFGGAPLRRPHTVERLLKPYVRADRMLGIAG